MTTVVFYEKPGCVNNTRQKAMLRAGGHVVIGKDLLTENWTPQSLRPYFGDLPVAQWFNRSAPRIKNGEVLPELMDEQGALAAMVRDPLLIRRPLMQARGECRAGFDVVSVAAWIGLSAEPSSGGDLESCPRADHAASCGEKPPR